MPIRRLIVTVLLLLVPVSYGWAAQTRARAHIVQNTARDQPGRSLRKLPRRGVNKRRSMRMGPKFFDRLMKMPAARRRKFLQENSRFQRLPPRQRQQIEQRLGRLSRMPKPQRERALERYRLFDRLPRQKQSEARAIYQRWQQLPQGRRTILLDEYDGLRESTPDARQNRFRSKEFSDEFSEEEQQVLMDLSDLLPERAGSDHP